jgi:pyruvate dehydrogenase E2 component (dihydrolipoamide acetyltransferase)
MSNEITMPKLSDTMEEGKIIRWLKHPGDSVQRGEPLAEVETDKADMVLEAFEDGVLTDVILKEGESAKVGEVIATMGKPGEVIARAPRGREPRALSAGDGGGAEGGQAEGASAEETLEGPEFHPAMSASLSAAPTAIPKPPRLASVKPKPTGAPAPGGEEKFKASPLARRAAEEAGIDLAHVRATGPDGRITKRDVDAHLREQQMFRVRRLVSPDKGAPGSREELSRMRKTIASRMAASKREIPHFYVTVEIDMGEAVRLKKSLGEAELF